MTVVNSRLRQVKTSDVDKSIVPSKDIFLDAGFPSLKGLPIIDKKTLGDYKVIKDTGFLKRHNSNPDDNLFAVSVLDRGSLEREATILRNCSGHENFPSLHGVTRIDDGEYGLVFDIPYGDDMETLSSSGELEKFSFRERIYLALQMCGAVAYLHQNRIIHQAICPSNIIIDKNTLKVTLIGFGNAFYVDDAAKPRGHGVPKYTAPETVLDNGTASFKADVWSLGMVLALLFTSLQPYHEYQPANIAKFQEIQADNQNRPRYAQTRSDNVEMKHYIGQGKAMEQVGTLINLAVCPTPELRSPAQQLLGAFAMLLTEEK
ncbi:testis-specific serine/threonine-protein kinase 6-like [Ptychodera flava]|uniref:testis-specific serine/threonine-protein kinase 6-like n=1 Tax=Ptychodera flava TaxID=63121 RepID=UPI00396A0C03